LGYAVAGLMRPEFMTDGQCTLIGMVPLRDGAQSVSSLLWGTASLVCFPLDSMLISTRLSLPHPSHSFETRRGHAYYIQRTTRVAEAAENCMSGVGEGVPFQACPSDCLLTVGLLSCFKAHLLHAMPLPVTHCLTRSPCPSSSSLDPML
jgi:hypothetical protein